MNPDYIINPVMMGGIINGYDGEYAKINLFGRLGVIKIKPELIDGNAELGSIMEFYFSYIQVVKDPYDYTGRRRFNWCENHAGASQPVHRTGFRCG